MRYFIYGALALTLAACQPTSEASKSSESKDTSSHQHTTAASAATAQTQVTQVDGFQVSFDITTMAEHHQMMDSMGMSMGAEHQEKMAAGELSHYVMVTVLDAEKKPLADVPLKLKVIDPEGNPLGEASGVVAETMSGQGMFHYGHGFALAKPGRYQVMVMFAVEGKPHHTGIFWEATP